MNVERYEPSTGQLWLAFAWAGSLAGTMLLVSRFGLSGPFGQLVDGASELTIAVVGIVVFLTAGLAFVAGLFRYVYDRHPELQRLDVDEPR